MTCRICSCSEDHACVVDDMACSWLAPELCDFCAVIVGESLLQDTFPDQYLHLASWLLSIFNRLYDKERYLLIFADLLEYGEALRRLGDLAASQIEPPRVVLVTDAEANAFLRARGAGG